MISPGDIFAIVVAAAFAYGLISFLEAWAGSQDK